MMLQLFFPVIMLILSQDIRAEDAGDVSGVHTTTSHAEKQIESPTPDLTPTASAPSSVVESSESSSVVTNTTGDSNVHVKIENNNISVSTNGGSSGSVNISSFQYPGSTVQESSGNRMVMESGDSAERVTTWYQDKIQGMGMSAKSFVKTNSNGSILNKLAAGGNGSVSVEISAQEGAHLTKIVVATE